MPFLLDLDGAPRPSNNRSVYKFDANDGALPSWLTAGQGVTVDTGMTSSWTAFGAGLPALTLTSAVQSGTASTAPRRAAIVGPTISMANVAGIRFRVVHTGGSQTTQAARIGFSADPSNTTLNNAAVMRSSGTDYLTFATMNMATGGTSDAVATRFRWMQTPARHDLFIHLLPKEGNVAVGYTGNFDWSNLFPGRDLSAATLRPFIEIRTIGDTYQSTLLVHHAELIIDFI